MEVYRAFKEQNKLSGEIHGRLQPATFTRLEKRDVCYGWGGRKSFALRAGVRFMRKEQAKLH